jgi:hypothetical protein
MAMSRGPQNKANGNVGSSKETTTAKGQQQRSFSPRRLLMYECSQVSSGSTKRTTKRTSVSHSHCQNISTRNSKRLICHSNGPENEIKLHPLGQSITTSVHNCPPLGQGKLNATTHGSRRDTRHLPVQKDGQKWETSSSFKHVWMRHSSSPMACQTNTCNNWRRCCKRLEDKSFRANRRKCYFARGAHLGYWLTRQSKQPQPKKVEAILRLSAPQNRRQLRHFLGMVI